MLTGLLRCCEVTAINKRVSNDMIIYSGVSGGNESQSPHRSDVLTFIGFDIHRIMRMLPGTVLV